MARIWTAAAVGAALVLSGCGGGGGPGGGGAKGEAMKPCEAANKETPKALSSAKSGRMTYGEAKLVADEAVQACEAAYSAWEKLNVGEACLEEADARRGFAWATRAALDHQISRPYKLRIDREKDRIERAEDACKAAPAPGAEEAAKEG